MKISWEAEVEVDPSSSPRQLDGSSKRRPGAGARASWRLGAERGARELELELRIWCRQPWKAKKSRVPNLELSISLLTLPSREISGSGLPHGGTAATSLDPLRPDI